MLNALEWCFVSNVRQGNRIHSDLMFHNNSLKKLLKILMTTKFSISCRMRPISRAWDIQISKMADIGDLKKHERPSHIRNVIVWCASSAPGVIGMSHVVRTTHVLLVKPNITFGKPVVTFIYAHEKVAFVKLHANCSSLYLFEFNTSL